MAIRGHRIDKSFLNVGLFKAMAGGYIILTHFKPTFPLGNIQFLLESTYYNLNNVLFSKAFYSQMGTLGRNGLI